MPVATEHVREVNPRKPTPQVAARVPSLEPIPRAPIVDPNEDCTWVQELEECNDLLLQMLQQQGERAELEQQWTALTNRLRARSEQHAAAVAEVARAQHVIEALQSWPIRHWYVLVNIIYYFQGYIL